MAKLNTLEQGVVNGMVARRPDLEMCVPDMLRVHDALVHCYDSRRKLLVCGNGGSNADARHIAG